MNESKKGDEAGSQSASLTSQTTPPGPIGVHTGSADKATKSADKKKSKAKKKEKKEKKKKSKKKKSKKAAAPDTKKADEEENHSNQFEVKEVDPNIVDLKASTKSAVVDNEGTAVDRSTDVIYTRV